MFVRRFTVLSVTTPGKQYPALCQAPDYTFFTSLVVSGTVAVPGFLMINIGELSGLLIHVVEIRVAGSDMLILAQIR